MKYSLFVITFRADYLFSVITCPCVFGDGTTDHKMNVKVGDRVLYGKYSGTELTIEDTDYLIMKESDIFGIV